METKFTKVLNSSIHCGVELKMNRKNDDESHLNDVVRVEVPLQCTLNSSMYYLVVQKFDGPRRDDSSLSLNLEKSLQVNYFNFNNSGFPKRIMYYRNGVWDDFSQDVVAFIKNEMQTKKVIMEVIMDDNLFLLDLLHMIRMHLETGVQQPIAWVDEAGNCYFPENFVDVDNFDDCNNYKYIWDNYHLGMKQHGNGLSRSSPRMPFHVLLASLSSKLSEQDMHLVNRHFKLFQSKMIGRRDFIMRLRLIVGDTLLKSIFTSL